jgi:hypothetical protein
VYASATKRRSNQPIRLRTRSGTLDSRYGMFSG